MYEQTFAMIKPDAVEAHYLDEIKKAVADAGFEISDYHLTRLDPQRAAELYAEHLGKPFYVGLLRFTTSGPLAGMVLSCEGAIAKWRQMMGASDPSKAEPGTIRRDYGWGMPDNAVHGSDSLESAKREIALWRSWWAEVR